MRIPAGLRLAAAVLLSCLAVFAARDAGAAVKGSIRPVVSRSAATSRTTVAPLPAIAAPLGLSGGAMAPAMAGQPGSAPAVQPVSTDPPVSPARPVQASKTDGVGHAQLGPGPSLEKRGAGAGRARGRIAQSMVERSQASGRSPGLYGHLVDSLKGEGDRSPEAAYLRPSREALASPGSAKEWGDRSFQVLTGDHAAATTAAPVPSRKRRFGLLPALSPGKKTLGAMAASVAALAAFPSVAQAGEGGILETAGGWLGGAWDFVSGLYGSISWQYMVPLMVGSLILQIALKKVRRMIKERRQEARELREAEYRPSVVLKGGAAAQRLAAALAGARRPPKVKIYDVKTETFQPYELSAPLFAQVQAGVYELVAGTAADPEFYLVRTGVEMPAGTTEVESAGAESASAPEGEPPRGEPVIEDSFSPLVPPHGR